MENSIKYPHTLDVAVAVGKVTFTEIVRDRVLYNILICAFFLLGIGFLASRLTFIRPDRVILDFGLSAVSLSCCLIGILTGSAMLAKEFDRRTIYVALCHPISRTQFLIGKFAGLAAVISVNWTLLTLVYLGILISTSDQGWGIVSSTLMIALILSWFQSILISSIAVFFSVFSTTSLSVMISIGFYLIGNNISQLKLAAVRMGSPMAKFAVNLLATFLPNLEHFNLGTDVTYALPVSWQFICLSILYCLSVVAFLLIFAGFLIQSREV